MFDKITEAEIKNIDDRIKSAMIENPDKDCNKFYVKIWFNYKHNYSKNIKTDGRHEFSSTNKNKIITKIKSFLNNTEGFTIIK